MRFLLLIPGISVYVVAIGTRAEAQAGGGTNCGFISFEQCIATANGLGGFCYLNTRYQPPPGPHPPMRLQGALSLLSASPQHCYPNTRS